MRAQSDLSTSWFTFAEGSSRALRRSSRAAVAANPWALRPVPTVEEYPLASDDADEADERGYLMPELHDSAPSRTAATRHTDECDEVLQRAELEEEEAE